MLPPVLHSANAEAMAGESSAVPLDDLYLDGMVHVFGTVEFWASTAEAPMPMVRRSEIMVVMSADGKSGRTNGLKTYCVNLNTTVSLTFV